MMHGFSGQVSLSQYVRKYFLVAGWIGSSTGVLSDSIPWSVIDDPTPQFSRASFKISILLVVDAILY